MGDESIIASMWQLVIEALNTPQKRLNLRPGITRIGRASTNEIMVDDSAASRFHACIDFKPEKGSITLTDLQSTNGTYLNRERIMRPTPLKNKDTIRIGQVLVHLENETETRPAAVKEVAPPVDADSVVGSPKSSKSQRLREVAERAGAPAQLVQSRGEIDWAIFGNISSLGITAGASAPEVLVEEIMDAFAERYEVTVETVSTADESVSFPLPKELRPTA